MLPQYHLTASFAASVVYISGRMFIFDKVISLSGALVAILAASITGVLIDADHLIWTFFLSPKLTCKYVFTLNFMGLYRDLVSPDGYFHRRVDTCNLRIPNIFFIVHSLWIAIIGVIVYILLPDDYALLFVIVLFLHFVLDLPNIWRKKR